jgi:hypothetical protein
MALKHFETSGKIKITAGVYSIEMDKTGPLYADIYSNDTFVARIVTVSMANLVDSIDAFITIGNPKITIRENQILVEIPVKSDIWKEKIVVFQCDDDCLRYYLKLTGTGRIDKLNFFSGISQENKIHYNNRNELENYPRGHTRPFEYFVNKSKSGFKSLFNPQPNGFDKQIVHYFENTFITMLGDHSYLGSNFYFAPSPFCYGLNFGNKWGWIGIAAVSGQNNYSSFGYAGGENFDFSLDFQGCYKTSGEWKTPEIVFGFNLKNEYDAIQDHVIWLEKEHFIEAPKSGEKPSWWSEPLFCGWGDQAFLARECKNDDDLPGYYATQDNYTRFVNGLASKNLPFRSVIIDWQWALYPMNPYPDEGKWPNMRTFVDEQHKQGRKVIAHIRTWLKNGVPKNECILSQSGEPVTVDPTNPAFVKRLKKRINYLISPKGLNMDGIKTDGNWRGPTGKNLQIYKNLGGLELQKLLFSILHDATKDVKPDALLTGCVTHPIIRGSLDMIRLNDIFCDRPEQLLPKMQHRAKIAKIGTPDMLIDCDNWTWPNKASFLSYMELQPKIGVPSLYYSIGLEKSGELLTDADFSLLRKFWKK